MTYLRSSPSGFDNVFPLPRYEHHMVPAHCAGDRQHAVAVRVRAPSIVERMLRSWRQHFESRRALHHLLQLDDHLLRDIGLTRPDLHFGDFETLGRDRRAGGVR